MADREATGKRRGRGRWFVLALLLLLGLGAVVAALLYTGIPQQRGTEYLLSSQLGAEARVNTVSFRNPLVVQGFRLTSQAAALYGPVLKVDRTEARYDWRPENKRYIKRVDVSGIQLALRQDAEGNNFQFLLDRFDGPGGGGDVTPWIPEQVGVRDLWIELDFPSYYLRMDKLGLQAQLADAATGSIALNAPGTGIAWSSLYTPGGRRTSTGSVSIQAAWEGASADIDAEIDLGPLARGRGSASIMQRDGEPFYALSIPEASLEDPLWSAMLADVSPVPLRFERVAIAGSDIHFHRTDERLVVDQATADAEVRALGIGPVDAPYYAGPLALAVRGQYGAETTITGTATLVDGVTLEGDFQTTPGGIAGTFGWAPWPRATLAKLIPPDYAATLDLFEPLQDLGARGTFARQSGEWHVDATLTGAFGGGKPLEAPLVVALKPAGSARILTMDSTLALHGGTVKSTVTAPPDGPPTVDNSLAAIQINPWTEYLFGSPLLPWFSGAISGKARVAIPPDKPLAIDVDLTGTGLRYGDLVLPDAQPVRLNGRMTYTVDTNTLASSNLHLEQEGVMDITSAAWALDLDRGAMDTALDSTLALDAVAALFGLDGLYGNAAIQGALAIGPETTRLNAFTARSEDLLYEDPEYGDWSVPYGLALDLAGSLVYTRAENTLRLEPVEATLGAGATCTIGALTFRLPAEASAFAMSAAPLTLKTDLQLLVRRGLLASVTGGDATFKSDRFGWNGETFEGLLSWEIQADQIELPDQMAALDTVAWSGHYNPGDEEAGGGRLSADHFSIYEIPFGPADTQLKVTPKNVTSDSFVTTFLGGNLLLSGALDYHDPTFPGAIEMEVRDLDLAEFTKVFEPPDVVLTGKVSGTADIALSTDGLRDLRVDLSAADNLTLNRSMVRQILMSQYVNDAVGRKSVQKVIERVIGEAEQRPFDHATLELRLVDGVIQGVARLESKSLDVTVDINADPKAILEAIRSTAENR